MASQPARAQFTLIVALALTATTLVTPSQAEHNSGPAPAADLLDLDEATSGGANVIDPNGAAALPWDWATLFGCANVAPPVDVASICAPIDPAAGAPGLENLVVASFLKDHTGNGDGTTDATNFATGGSKDINPISQWACTTATDNDGKFDIYNAYAAWFTDARGDHVIFVGSERGNAAGTAFAGFWLLQEEVGCSGSGAFSGAHRVNDLFVVGDFTGGGGTTNFMQLYRWDGTQPVLLSGGARCASLPAGALDVSCGEVNSVSRTTPWSPRTGTVSSPGSVGGSYATNRMIEAGLNLSGILGPHLGGTPFPCFQTMIAEARSSAQLTAQLKDYAAGNFRTCDARITVDPLLADNPVGTTHTFTFTVTKKELGGAFAPAVGEVVVASIASGPGTFVGPNTCTTDAAGQCSVTITSDASGATVLVGSIDVIVQGTPLHRETDGTHGNSAPAVKTWLRIPSNVATLPSAASITLGENVTDAITVSGDLGAPTGTVTVYACLGSCATSGALVGLATLSGGSAASPPFAPTSVGTWCFRVEYGGDGTYEPSSDASPHECFDVTRARVALATLAMPNLDGVAPGAAVLDTASVTGLGAPFPPPTGTVTFYLCGPSEASPSGCLGGTLVGTSDLEGAGGSTSPTATTLGLGFHCWRAVYSGDANYHPAEHTDSTLECFTVRHIDVSFAKSVNAASGSGTSVTASPGELVEFVLTLRATGNWVTNDVVVSDTVPPRSTLVSCDPPCTFSDTTPGSAITWTQDEIGSGAEAEFSFIVVLNDTFPAGETIIPNIASVTTTRTGTTPSNPVTVIVTAVPDLGLVKSADESVATEGDLVTYTLEYYNEGDGDVLAATIAELVPDGTAFESCTGGCVEAAGVVTWLVGPVPARTSADEPAGSVSMTVRVADEHGCEVCNVATIASVEQNGGEPIGSNEVCLSIVPDPAKATANGAALGAHLWAPLLGVSETLSLVESDQAGLGGDDANATAQTVVLLDDGKLLKVDAARVVTTSTVENGASRTLAVSELVGVNIMDGLVTAGTIRGVADASATSTATSVSSLGTLVEDLRVNGVQVQNVAPGVNVPIPAMGVGSYLRVAARDVASTVPAGGSGGTYASAISISALLVHLADIDPVTPGDQPLDIRLGGASASASQPQLTLCEATGPRAGVASARVVGALGVDAGAASAPSTGGADGRSIDGTGSGQLPPGIVYNSGATFVALDLVDDVESAALSGAAGAWLLDDGAGGFLVSTTHVVARSLSTASGGGASSSAGESHLAHLVVNGVAIDDDVAPNTIIDLPGVGFVVLNEQVADAAAPGSSGLRARAIHVVLTAGPLMGTEIVVAEAYSAASAA